MRRLPTGIPDDAALPSMRSASKRPIALFSGTVDVESPYPISSFLSCRQREVSGYPELYALLGGRVPDLRGLFLRGVGGNSAGLGVKQEDAFKAHSHRTPMAAKDEGGGFYSGGSIFSGYWDTEEVGGIETRPVNQAVRYLVRARP